MIKKLSKRKILERQILKQLNELFWEPPTLQQQIQSLLKAAKESMELKTKEQMKSIILSVEDIKSDIDKLNKIQEILGNKEE